eukprot:2986233-Pyramimonas_sp.AAC.1
MRRPILRVSQAYRLVNRLMNRHARDMTMAAAQVQLRKRVERREGGDLQQGRQALLRRDVDHHRAQLRGLCRHRECELGPAKAEFGPAAGGLGPAKGPFGPAKGPFGSCASASANNPRSGVRVPRFGLDSFFDPAR